jgi:hypothetical protein
MAPRLTERRETRATVIACLLALACVLVYAIGFPPFDRRAAATAALSAWIVGGCGLITWLRVPESRTGPLLVASACASAVAILVGGGIMFGGELAPALGASAAALAAHAIVGAPWGRATGRTSRTAVGAGYLACLVPEVAGAVQAAAAVIGLAARSALRTSRPSGMVVAAAIAFVLGSTPVALWFAGFDPRIDPRVVEDLWTATVGVLIALDVLGVAARRRRILDLVAGLDARASPTVIPSETIPIDDGASVDAGTTDVLRRAQALVEAHRRLGAEVVAQADAVERSRRRLIRAADDERLHLRLELEERVEPLLVDLESRLTALGQPGSGRIGGGAPAQVHATRDEIARILHGLPPRALDGRGLASGLRDLARRSSPPASVGVTDDGPPDLATRSALYFTGSEALTNAARHARARKIEVRLVCDDRTCVLEVADDGVGGADAGRGTGLIGIRDRLAAVNGRLEIESNPGTGTRLTAIVPVEVGPAHGSDDGPGLALGEPAGRYSPA